MSLHISYLIVVYWINVVCILLSFSCFCRLIVSCRFYCIVSFHVTFRNLLRFLNDRRFSILCRFTVSCRFPYLGRFHFHVSTVFSIFKSWHNFCRFSVLCRLHSCRFLDSCRFYTSLLFPMVVSVQFSFSYGRTTIRLMLHSFVFIVVLFQFTVVNR